MFITHYVNTMSVNLAILLSVTILVATVAEIVFELQHVTDPDTILWDEPDHTFHSAHYMLQETTGDCTNTKETYTMEAKCIICDFSECILDQNKTDGEDVILYAYRDKINAPSCVEKYKMLNANLKNEECYGMEMDTYIFKKKDKPM